MSKIRNVLIALVFMINLVSINALELKRVILATNNNPLYIQFWPIVAPIWQSMGIRPTLALIADESCQIDTTIGDVIRFSPIVGVPEAMHAQVIRLFLPALFPEDGCIISDIDMIPISKSYFFDGAALCPDDAFLVYREAWNGTIMGYPMCYNAAKGAVFASMFNVHTIDDMLARIKEWADLGHGWNTDEIMLYHTIHEWEKKGGKVLRLRHEVFGRLDRGNWNHDFDSLDISEFIDCHCPRPYEKYKETIDKILGQVAQKLIKS